MASKPLIYRENFTFGPFVLDSARGTLRRDGELVSLPPKVFETLRLLVAERGEVVSKSYMMEGLWPDSFVQERSLTQNIFLLRRILGKTETGEDYIETLAKRGYRISVPVQCDLSAEGPELPEGVANGDAPELSPDNVPQEPVLGRVERQPPHPLAPRSEPVARRWAGWIAVGLAGCLLAAGVYVEGRRAAPAVLHFERLTNDRVDKNHLAGLHTDGTRVYFTETVDQKTLLAQVDLAGGETSRQPTPYPDAVAFDYSPHSNEILFDAVWEQPPERPLTAMSIATGAVRKVGDLSAHGAAWSPDGRRMAYVTGTGLYVARNDGSDARLLASTRDVPFWPKWSPDGKRIRFSQNASGQGMTLWEIEADGHGLKRLFAQEPFGSNACCGDWSPDGRYYVFSVDQAKQSSLWVVRDRPRVWERNQPVRLAEGPMDFWRAPIFTPDGRNILALGEHLRGESIKFDPKSGSFHPYPGAPSADTIAFSRDGQWMAYTTYPEGILWRSRVDGSDRLQLTTAPNISRFPQWSPDGTQLIYIAASGGNQWKIHKISANGGNSEVVLDDGSSQGVATWSPDGHHIAFGDIVVFGVGQQDGKQIRILDLDTKASTTLPGSEGLWTARWSPDGRYLSALTIDNRKLMLYDFNSGRWTQLANTGINDVVWSRDSRNIYFDSSDQASIYRVSVADKKVTEFATVGGIRRTGFFGTTLSIAPDNNLLLFQNVGGQEVYRLEVSLP